MELQSGARRRSRNETRAAAEHHAAKSVDEEAIG
jgi:hypothetical protein